MSGINGANYPILFQYGILTQPQSNKGIANIGLGSVTVNNGYYNNVIQGTIVGSGSPSGVNNTDVSTAINQLNQLISDINTYASSGIPNVTILQNSGGNDETFTPGVYYTDTGYFRAFDFGGVNSTYTFDAQGNPNSQFFLISTSNNDLPNYDSFTYLNLNIVLVNGALPSNIFWLAAPVGNISFTSFPSDPALVLKGNFIVTKGENSFNNISTIDGNIFSLNIDSSVEAVVFDSNNSNINTIVNAVGGPVICYAKGTKILTKKGFVAIEDLKLNDKILTKGKILFNPKPCEYILKDDDFKLESIVWISKFTKRNLTKKSAPICIKKDALKKNYPFEDLYVSPNHSIILKGKMIHAKKLVNGKTIFQDFKKEEVEYYHLELESHSAIIANGILSESYLDFTPFLISNAHFILVLMFFILST